MSETRNFRFHSSKVKTTHIKNVFTIMRGPVTFFGRQGVARDDGSTFKLPPINERFATTAPEFRIADGLKFDASR